jgi:hypothetical protein
MGGATPLLFLYVLMAREWTIFAVLSLLYLVNLGVLFELGRRLSISVI